jgi:hypothetical protein
MFPCFMFERVTGSGGISLEGIRVENSTKTELSHVFFLGLTSRLEIVHVPSIVSKCIARAHAQVFK